MHLYIMADLSFNGFYNSSFCDGTSEAQTTKNIHEVCFSSEFFICLLKKSPNLQLFYLVHFFR